MEGITQRLRSYAASRKGELADLVNEAADALEVRDTDCISRLELQEDLKRCGRICEINSEDEQVYGYVCESVDSIIRDLPSVQPERKTGRWEEYLKEGLRWKCSECGSRFDLSFDYCPHCGAEMAEGDDNEQSQ